MNRNEFIDKCFKDTKGKVVLAQFPNIPLIGWFLFEILSRINLFSRFSDFFSLLSLGFLFTWGYLELFHGVNYFRRLVGLLGLIYVIINWI